LFLIESSTSRISTISEPSLLQGEVKTTYQQLQLRESSLDLPIPNKLPFRLFPLKNPNAEPPSSFDGIERNQADSHESWWWESEEKLGLNPSCSMKPVEERRRGA